MRRDVLLLAAICCSLLDRCGRGGALLQGGPLDGPRPPKSIASARRRGARRNMWKLIDPYSVAVLGLLVGRRHPTEALNGREVEG